MTKKRLYDNLFQLFPISIFCNIVDFKYYSNSKNVFCTNIRIAWSKYTSAIFWYYTTQQDLFYPLLQSAQERHSITKRRCWHELQKKIKNCLRSQQFGKVMNRENRIHFATMRRNPAVLYQLRHTHCLQCFLGDSSFRGNWLLEILKNEPSSSRYDHDLQVDFSLMCWVDFFPHCVWW